MDKLSILVYRCEFAQDKRKCKTPSPGVDREFTRDASRREKNKALPNAAHESRHASDMQTLANTAMLAHNLRSGCRPKRSVAIQV